MQQNTQGPLLPLTALALALGLGVNGAACAQEKPSWSMSGFGTLGLAHSSEHQADYTSSSLKASGAGATHPWSAAVDTHLGAQLDVTLNRQWSAVVQVVSEQDLDNNYRPRIEWANVKYQLTPELALRAGRIALPLFLTADCRKIGYVYPWVRPPVEIYSAVPFTSSDGVDATWRWNAGEVRNASQFFYGHYDMPLGPTLHGHARRIVGMSNTSDWGALGVRASVINAEATIDLASQLFAAFEGFGPAGQAIGKRYAIDHKRATVASIGLNYDPGQWFVMAEASGTHSDSLLGATRGAYASAGWRWRTLTPYLSYARVRASGATRDDGLPAAAGLNAGLNAYLAMIPQQSTASAGLRWDLHPNMALKLQYDRVTPHDGSNGTLINPTPGFQSGHPANVLSAALDVVY